MSAELRNQIRANLGSKSTEELLEIWQTNDRVEWSDLAFEVLAEILKERIGALPGQGEPVLDHDEEPDDDLDDWEAKILDSEDQPELYDTIEVIDLIRNIKKVATATIVIYIFANLINTRLYTLLTDGAVSFSPDLFSVIWELIYILVLTALRVSLVYFPLMALVQILRILMEMEFTSRTK